MPRPKLYLTNFSSRKAPHRGPGSVYTMMIKPKPERGWLGQGRVWPLTPCLSWLEAYLAGHIDLAMYEQLFVSRLKANPQMLNPGKLLAERPVLGQVQVRGGDTVCCACARAKAERRECHRAFVAPFLHSAGWQVVLDGEDFAP